MNAEINVTSLVDVAFTLLVIFMITMPILQGGIEVDVPKAVVRALTSEETPFFISITADGRIFMEESEVTIGELEGSLERILAAGEIERIFIRGDSLANWGPVLKTMAIAVNSGATWSVVAEPYMERR